jgi:hypothetical protein
VEKILTKYRELSTDLELAEFNMLFFIASYIQAVINSPEKRTLASRKESEQIGRSSEERIRKKGHT